MTAVPEPAASLAVPPDPIAAPADTPLRDVISVSSKQTAPVTHSDLEALHFNAVEDLVCWFSEREATRDTELAELHAKFAELRAEFAGLKKAGNEPDLDGEPPRGGPLKRVCEVVHRTGWSETRIRSWARAGVINSQYFGSRLFIDERDVPVKKRKS
jgi:hypothetical protein